jgi:hypothetical protein
LRRSRYAPNLFAAIRRELKSGWNYAALHGDLEPIHEIVINGGWQRYGGLAFADDSGGSPPHLDSLAILEL